MSSIFLLFLHRLPNPQRVFIWMSKQKNKQVKKKKINVSLSGSPCSKHRFSETPPPAPPALLQRSSEQVWFVWRPLVNIGAADCFLRWEEGSLLYSHAGPGERRCFPPHTEPPLSDKPPARTTWNNNSQKLLDHVRRKSYQRSGLGVWSHLCSPYSRGDERPLDEDLDVMWQLTDSNSGNPVGSAGMHRVPTITDLSAELWPPIRESPQITSHFDSRLCESAARQKMWREASGAA